MSEHDEYVVNSLVAENADLKAQVDRLRRMLANANEQRESRNAEFDALSLKATKYASELQELADIIIGGDCVPAPFREVKGRLLELKKPLTSTAREAYESQQGLKDAASPHRQL